MTDQISARVITGRNGDTIIEVSGVPARDAVAVASDYGLTQAPSSPGTLAFSGSQEGVRGFAASVQRLADSTGQGDYEPSPLGRALGRLFGRGR